MKKFIWTILIIFMTSTSIFADCYDLTDYNFGNVYNKDTIEQVTCIYAETWHDAYTQAYEKVENLVLEGDLNFKVYFGGTSDEGCPDEPLSHVTAGHFRDMYNYDLIYVWLYFARKCCDDRDGDGNCDADDCDGDGDECDNNKQCPNNRAGDPINILSGNLTEEETDLQFDTPFERGFKFSRKYKSGYSENSAIGFGWAPNFLISLQRFDTADGFRFKIKDESGHIHQFIDTDNDGTYSPKFSTSDGYLSVEPDGSVTWHRESGIRYHFNNQYKLVTKEDGSGNVQSLAYDTNGRLETIHDQASGRSMGFFYNIDGKIVHITGPVTDTVPDGIWVRYQYDNDNLTQVEYADDGNGSSASGFEYKYEDPSDVHNLTEKVNLSGQFLSSWAYDYQDRVYENITRDAKGVSINYSASSTTVTDAQGVERTYNIEMINGKKKVTSVTGSGACGSCSGDVVRYVYDDQHRVIEKELSNGRIDQYADFDANDRYLYEIQAVGTPEERSLIYTLHPDTGERLTITESSILGDGNKETIFDYDDDGDSIPNETPTRLMHRRIERGYTFDESGTVTPYEYVTVYTYTNKGQVKSVDGPLPGDQDKVTYTYDPITGDRLTETRPLVGTTHYTYDAAGNLESITDPNGILTVFTYDGRNRRLSETRNGVTTSATYTAAGEPDTTTDELNRTMDYTYNTAGFVEKIIDPSGNFIYYGYNSLGQRTEYTLHAADGTQTLYRGTAYGDPANNPDLVSGKPWKTIRRNHDDTAYLETVSAYDSAGNLKSLTDAKGTVTAYSYDPFNRLDQVTQPGDAVTTYTYDLQGNLASVTDAEGHVTLYTYDDMGRLLVTDSPDTGITRYSYDEAGNLRFKVQNGNSIEYQYDLLGRLTNILYSDAAQNVTIIYDSGAGANLIGRLAKVTDPSGDVAYSYDDDGNVKMETRTVNGVSYVTGYGYDTAGNLRSITYPTGHTITYQPDSIDPARIAGVVFDVSQPLVSNISYAPFGPITAMTMGNGVLETMTYDKNYQMLTLTAGSAMNRTYTPDSVGNIEVIDDNLDAASSQSFDYDDLSRLTFASGNYGNIDYTYDKVGNRTSRSHGTENDVYTYDSAANQLQAVTGSHPEQFNYNNDGSTIIRTSGADQITYDYYDGTQRLKTTEKTSQSPTGYTYSSSGQRVIKDAASDVIYHYDLSGQLIAETTATGTPIKSYIWLHGHPLAMIDHQSGSCPGDIDHNATVDGVDIATLASQYGTSCNGCAADIDQDGQIDTSDLALLAARLGKTQCTGSTIFYYHDDHLGTPQKMTDAYQNIVWAADYLPFGQADVTVNTVSNNLRFAGQYYDRETGLHYNYHRYYDPVLGRYVRIDPYNFASVQNDVRFLKEIKNNFKIGNNPFNFNSDKNMRDMLLNNVPLVKMMYNPSHLNYYSYVGNNPISFFDPRGLKFTTCEKICNISAIAICGSGSIVIGMISDSWGGAFGVGCGTITWIICDTYCDDFCDYQNKMKQKN